MCWAVGHSFAYVAHFIRDVWIRTHSAAVENGRSTNFATDLAIHHSDLATHLSDLATNPSDLAT